MVRFVGKVPGSLFFRVVEVVEGLLVFAEENTINSGEGTGAYTRQTLYLSIGFTLQKHTVGSPHHIFHYGALVVALFDAGALATHKWAILLFVFGILEAKLDLFHWKGLWNKRNSMWLGHGTYLYVSLTG